MESAALGNLSGLMVMMPSSDVSLLRQHQVSHVEDCARLQQASRVEDDQVPTFWLLLHQTLVAGI